MNDNNFQAVMFAVIQLTAAWHDANVIGGYLQISDELDQFVTNLENFGDCKITEELVRLAREQGDDELRVAMFLANLLDSEIEKYWQGKEKDQDGEIPF
jgi:hypothetical protein